MPPAVDNGGEFAPPAAPAPGADDELGGSPWARRAIEPESIAVEPDDSVETDDDPTVLSLPPEDEDDEHTVLSLREPRGKTFRLAVVGGEEYELPSEGTVEVGRASRGKAASPGVIFVQDPTRTLSKKHVRLRRDGDNWFITDLRSTNGTSLRDEDGNVVDLLPGEEAEVKGVIQLGDLDVEVRASEGTGAE